jgi:pimeloyl-ACP methyl ester carboxylesterase
MSGDIGPDPVGPRDGISLDCEIPTTNADLPLAHEMLWGLDWLALKTSAVYRGDGVPRGDGRPVILVPGFLGSAAEMGELHRWLERAGFDVYPPGFHRNVDCPDILLDRLIESIDAAYEAGGTRLTLVGHSLGGSIARAAAVRVPSMVGQVITLASPLREIAAHPLVLNLARMLATILPRPDAQPRQHGDHVHDTTCACEMIDALAQPWPERVARTAIYTRADGVVDWRTCVEPDDALNIEVPGTHIGMVVNPRVYETLARLLAAPRAPSADAIPVPG